jgi:hypothetical protein
MAAMRATNPKSYRRNSATFFGDEDFRIELRAVMAGSFPVDVSELVSDRRDQREAGTARVCHHLRRVSR